MNFYVWLVLTTAITAFVWVAIVKKLKTNEAEKISAAK